MHSNNNTLMDKTETKKYDYESLRKKRSVCTKLCVSVILNIILIALLALCALVFMFSDSESSSTSTSSCYNFSSDHLTNLLNENFTVALDESGNSTVTQLPESEDPFVGTYELDTSENFDAFLKELGVGYLKRQIAKRTKSTYEITRNDDVYTLKTLSSVSSSEISFKLNGEEFEEDRLDGNRVKSKMVRSGNKWIQKQFGEKEVTLIREFEGDIIKLTCIVNGVTAVRIYKRIPKVEDGSD